MAFRMV